MKIYRIAQEKKVKKPYSVFRLAHGQEKFIVRVWAFSSEQARAFAISEISVLSDYLNMGYEIVARLDEEKWNEIERANKAEETLREQTIQDAWWQD